MDIRNAVRKIYLMNQIPIELRHMLQFIKIAEASLSGVPIIVKDDCIIVNRNVIKDESTLLKYLVHGAMHIIFNHIKRYNNVKEIIPPDIYNMAANAFINEIIYQLAYKIDKFTTTKIYANKNEKIEDIKKMFKLGKSSDLEDFLKKDIFLNDIEKLFDIRIENALAMTIEQLAYEIYKRMQQKEDKGTSINSESNCNTCSVKQENNIQHYNYMTLDFNNMIDGELIQDAPDITDDMRFILINRVLESIKDVGTNRGNFVELVKAKEHLQFDWRKYLEKFARDYDLYGKKIYDVRRTPMKINKLNPDLLGTKFMYKGYPRYLYAVIDTSASIPTEFLEDVFGKFSKLIKMSRIKVYYFDVDFYGPVILRSKKDFENIEVHGRGGTSPKKVLNHLKDEINDNDVMIFISDFVFDGNEIVFIPKNSLWIKYESIINIKVDRDPYKLF
jgi:predicted metal-dependent peptidase